MTIRSQTILTCACLAAAITSAMYFSCGGQVSTWKLLATSTVSFAALFGFVFRTFLLPLERLSNLLQKVSSTGNLSLRVPQSGGALLENITDSINHVLDTTEHSYLELLNARYEAENANKGKSLFIAKVSHELRTPIHCITGMLRILLQQEHTPGKRQYIQMAKDSADALLYTINEVLDFSKMQTGSLFFEREQVQLLEVIRGTINNLIPRFEEKPNVAFCWNVAPGIPSTVIGDSVRVRNILVNLLGNGFKFTERGFVTLDVAPYKIDTPERAGVRFTISDSGIGIAQDKQARIFDPFTTADEKTARLYSGTGLGLAIVKQIVEHMGGTISLTSSEGIGSTFTVDLPFEISKEKALSDSACVESKRVAVLADHGIRRDFVCDGLHRLGCEVQALNIESSESINTLIQELTHFDLVHIIKEKDVLLDELTPLLRACSRAEIPTVLSVTSSELASREAQLSSAYILETLQPTSALDVVLIASGALKPSTSCVASEETQEKTSHKLNILVADDAKTNRIILKTLLEEAGHTVELVENGQQLLERIANTPERNPDGSMPFDLVLTDIQMPVMDGLTATQNFREFERKSSHSKKLPIVAVTSYAIPEECTKMLASGIDHIITKPISPRRLSRLLSQITCEQTPQQAHDSVENESDSDIMAELSRVADTVALRVGSIVEELQSGNPQPDDVAIDISDVYERSGNSIRRTGLILSGFLESYRDPLTALEQTSVPLTDPVAFRRTVHSLKGLLLDVGAKRAGALAGLLEKRVLDAPDSISPESIKELKEAIGCTVLVVREIVEAIPSLEICSALPALDNDLLSIH